MLPLYAPTKPVYGMTGSVHLFRKNSYDMFYSTLGSLSFSTLLKRLQLGIEHVPYEAT